MSDNSSIVSHPPKSSHSTSPSHSPVVRTIVRTLKKGFRRYHQLLVTSPKSLDFKPFRASILLDSRQKNYRLHMARGNKIDTHFLRLFVRSGQKNISTGILQFCQLTGTYLRVFDHKSLSNVCSQLLCVRGNMSTGWKLSLSNRCRISSFFEMKK